MINSTAWIKENLPKDRIFLNDLNRNLLLYYGQSMVVKVPTDFFYSEDVLNEKIKESSSNIKKGLYIYYAKPDKRNPYIDRPYYKNNSYNETLIVDNYPKKFKRIYEDKKNNIIIWKVL